MTTPKTCCPPCPDVQTVNIPGVEGPEGEPGTDGTNGINAFTLTTAPFTVPLVGSNVTVAVGNSSWASVGQKIFVEGAGYFDCISKPTINSIILQYLDYAGNTNTGNNIATGAEVSPGGNQGPDATLLPGISDYAVGGSQAITTSPAQLLTLSVTLATSGSYLLMATCRVDFDAATFNADETITLKLRETNNGPADVANAIANLKTPLLTLQSYTFDSVPIPPVIYAAQAGDVIQLYGLISGSPYSGSLIAVEGSILAIKLF